MGFSIHFTHKEMEDQREWVAAPVTQHMSDVETGWMGWFVGALSQLPGWVPVFQIPRNWQVGCFLGRRGGHRGHL